MFRKPHDAAVSSRTLLRNKEGKAVRDAVVRQFPLLATGSLDLLLSPKSLEETKLASRLLLYGDAGDHVPLLLNLDPKSGIGKLIPTVFGLWRVAPAPLLPVIIVAPPVSAFVCNGADLMWAGVCAALPRFEAGAIVALSVENNPAPFAVGEALVSSTAAAAAGMKGRGVRILHCYLDSLWEGGGKSTPNAGFLSTQVVSLAPPTERSSAGAGDSAATGSTAAASLSAPLGAAEGTLPRNTEAAGGEGPSNSLAPAPASPYGTPEELLRATLLQALKRHVAGRDLPMLASHLFGVCMAAAKPAGTTLDVRHTPWKKTAAFLTAMATEGLLRVEEGAKGSGVLSIVSVDRTHPALKAFKPWPAAEESSAATAAAAAEIAEEAAAAAAGSGMGTSGVFAGPPIITEYMKAPPAARPIFGWVAALALQAGEKPLGVIVKRNNPRGRPGRRTAVVLPPTAGGGGGSKGGVAAAGSSAAALAAPQPSPLSNSSDDDNEGEDEEEEGDGSDDEEGEGEAGLHPSSSGAPRGWSDLATHIPSVLYTAGEVKVVLTAYIAARGLGLPSDKRRITLDHWLADAIMGGQRSGAAAVTGLTGADFPSLGGGGGGKQQPTPPVARAQLSVPPPPPFEHNPAASLPRDDVARLWLERAAKHAAHTVGTSGSSEVVLHAGAPPLVTLTVKALQGGRKHTTHVCGFQHYGVAAEPLAREAARRFAASATVQPSSLNPRVTEVMLQGDVAAALARALVEWYGLPPRLVVVK